MEISGLGKAGSDVVVMFVRLERENPEAIYTNY